MGLVTSSIAAMFAFFPPNPPSYTVEEDPDTGKLRLLDNRPGAAGAPLTLQCRSPLKDQLEIVRLRTRRKQTIYGAHVRNRAARLSLLYSHGNAADLGQMLELFVQLSAVLKVNVFGYDYTGYGACTGKPSEPYTYSDVDAAMEYLTDTCGVAESDIVLYGQSVGSGPTLDLAARRPAIRGVVLHSPLLSGLRVMYPAKKTYWFDIYKNIDKIPKVECPVFILHGTADEVVDVSHGRQLVELCQHPYEPLWIEGGTHGDLEFHNEYVVQLHKFIAFLEQQTSRVGP